MRFPPALLLTGIVAALYHMSRGANVKANPCNYRKNPTPEETLYALSEARAKIDSAEEDIDELRDEIASELGIDDDEEDDERSNPTSYAYEIRFKTPSGKEQFVKHKFPAHSFAQAKEKLLTAMDKVLKGRKIESWRVYKS